MTPEEITAMAKEAGMHIDRLPDDYCKDVGLPIGSVSRWDGVGLDELQAFAALVAAQEREACVQLVEAVKHCEQDPLLGAPVIARAINECADDLADAIRARGQKGGV